MNPFRRLLKPSSPFVPGDLCWLTLPSNCRYPELNGFECTVLTGLNQEDPDRSGRRFWMHRIEVIDCPGLYVVRPNCLVKQPPPTEKLAGWKSCPFKPKQVTS